MSASVCRWNTASALRGLPHAQVYTRSTSNDNGHNPATTGTVHTAIAGVTELAAHSKNGIYARRSCGDDGKGHALAEILKEKFVPSAAFANI